VGNSDRKTVISVRGLCKSFGDVKAVDGVDLDVYQGEVLGVLGPNGAGKTTLISMLTGISKSDSGSATICGFDLVKDSRQIKRIVSLVPQDLAMYMELSALDNMNFFANLYGLKGKEKANRIQEALDISQLQEWAHKKVGTFSGGMKRRLNLAVGFINHPIVIFLDEPTVGVDPHSRNYIFESIHRLVNQFKMTVIYTTHYMEEAEELCDRIAIYDQGMIVDLESTHVLLKKHGKTYLEISLADIDEKIIKAIKALPDVDSVNVSGGNLYIQSERLLETTESVLGLIRQAKVKVNSFNVRQSDMESVFLKLTGKKLRD